MSYISIRFTGPSKDSVESLAKEFVKQYPPGQFGTFFHSPRFVGYTDGVDNDSHEMWEIEGQRWKR